MFMFLIPCVKNKNIFEYIFFRASVQTTIEIHQIARQVFGLVKLKNECHHKCIPLLLSLLIIFPTIPSRCRTTYMTMCNNFYDVKHRDNIEN
jgi:hypothetical protein